MQRLEMRGFRLGPRTAMGACVPALAALPLPLGSQAADAPRPKAPAATARPGRERAVGASSQGLEFMIPKAVLDVFGSPVIFSGILSGTGAANHGVVMQASPYPFLAPFANIGTPGVTGRLGRFSFRISKITANTQLRMATVDPVPVYSRVVMLDVAVRVSFGARSSAGRGLVLLHGTVTPAVRGAKVYFQVLQPVRARETERARSYVSEFVTPVKDGNRKFSRFSLLVRVRKSGRYRAFVKVPPGLVVSGASAATIVLHAAPADRTKCTRPARAQACVRTRRRSAHGR
ncbi:MAG TPA: hypothetical protein VNY35_00435 [Solirubrobacteraceae bacterium]|jgi:hypothetical protein|nr:hypothetical protein [Solirubrobacteraceae bacterium]